jgi:hypothetical protein
MLRVQLNNAVLCGEQEGAGIAEEGNAGATTI